MVVVPPRKAKGERRTLCGTVAWALAVQLTADEGVVLSGVLLRRVSRAVRMLLFLRSWQRQNFDSSRGLFFSFRTNPPAMSRAAAVAGLRDA